ncbi:MAG: hypothetical protein P8Z00_12340 [Anaerolineales bacterium]
MKRIPKFLAIVTVLALSIISCGLFTAAPTSAPAVPSPAQQRHQSWTFPLLRTHLSSSIKTPIQAW